MPYAILGFAFKVKGKGKDNVVMARLTVYRDSCGDSTPVSNLFIDEYMKDANDAQLKVYLYLIRMLHANRATSVSDIADQFNHTEKDILRALKYWENKQLLDLDYDEDKNLTGIHMRELSGSQAEHSLRPSSELPVFKPAALPREAAPAEPSIPEKPVYSADRLRQFKDSQNTAQLLFIAESYIGRPLTPSEIQSLLFITDGLQFSDDLVDYLIQYCVEQGKKSFRYIEKVAIAWAQEGITTPKAAQELSQTHSRYVYAIMNGLGKSGNPTPREMEYINRWTKEYGFEPDVILEACSRTVLATDKHRFQYAESILNSWKKANVHERADIVRMDQLFQQKKASPRPSSNKFNQFAQNSYDFDTLEKELLSN